MGRTNVRLVSYMQGLKELSSLVSQRPAAGDPAAAEQVHAALELAAQLQYRLGRSKECIQLYDQLFQQHKVQDFLLACPIPGVVNLSSHMIGCYFPCIFRSAHLNSRQTCWRPMYQQA